MENVYKTPHDWNEKANSTVAREQKKEPGDVLTAARDQTESEDALPAARDQKNIRF